MKTKRKFQNKLSISASLGHLRSVLQLRGTFAESAV